MQDQNLGITSKKYAVIVAGGTGQRMGNPIPKQFIVLKGKPVIWHTISAFLNAYSDLEVILVLPGEYLSTGQEIVNGFVEKDRIRVVAGGKNRFYSVKSGLQQVPDDAIVFIHDGVRCLVSTRLIRECYDQAVLKGNAVPAIAPSDSIRRLTGSGNHVIDRNEIRLIQTPQTFNSSLIRKAYDREYEDSFSDEATVFEKMGHRINLVAGEASNLKITIPADLLFADQFLNSRTTDADIKD